MDGYFSRAIIDPKYSFYCVYGGVSRVGNTMEHIRTFLSSSKVAEYAKSNPDNVMQVGWKITGIVDKKRGIIIVDMKSKTSNEIQTNKTAHNHTEMRHFGFPEPTEIA